jgi:hypothetical protein
VKQFIRIGVDLAKYYFQVHALVSESGPAISASRCGRDRTDCSFCGPSGLSPACATRTASFAAKASSTHWASITVRRAEASDGTTALTAANELAIRRALEDAGVEFTNGNRPGVRLSEAAAERARESNKSGEAAPVQSRRAKPTKR